MSLFEDAGSSGNLGANLEAALDALGSGGELAAEISPFSDAELAFGDLEQGAEIRLEDVLSLAEKYPGLKITFSF